MIVKVTTAVQSYFANIDTKEFDIISNKERNYGTLVPITPPLVGEVGQKMFITDSSKLEIVSQEEVDKFKEQYPELFI